MDKKYKVTSLGCRTNQYEGKALENQLQKLGYSESEEDSSDADICIVNTCTVTHSADSASRAKIRNLLKKHPKAKVIVTGCMAEAAKEDLLKMDNRVEVFLNKDKEKIIEKLFPDRETYPEFNIEQFEGNTRAFVKIQDGCNSFCTYCILPYVRGRSRSRKISDILPEIKKLVSHGYKEIVLTGINIGDFDGGGENKRLSDLVYEVDKIEGLERIRISSIDPDEVEDDLLDAVVNCKKTCPSMHIVLQSGSNAVLKRMNRKYTKQMFLESIDRLRAVNPMFTFTTDVIVGFPGESKKDFEETLEIVKKVRFAKVHMFPYSRRDRTKAALYPDQVPQEVMTERKQILLHEAEKESYYLRESFVGTKAAVLCEKRVHEEYIEGHTETFLPIKIYTKELNRNDLALVEVIKNTEEGLVGNLIEITSKAAFINPLKVLVGAI